MSRLCLAFGAFPRMALRQCRMRCRSAGGFAAVQGDYSGRVLLPAEAAGGEQ
jgi:hypothetical protein